MFHLSKKLIGVMLGMGLLWLAVGGPACETAPVNQTPAGDPNDTSQLPTGPGTPTKFPINGLWRQAAVPNIPEYCLTFASFAVSRVDVGCTNSTAVILNKPQASSAGNMVNFIVDYQDSSVVANGRANLSYRVTPEGDNVMRGLCVLQYLPGGPVFTGEVVLTRQ